jgi:hypothetical protein
MSTSGADFTSAHRWLRGDQVAPSLLPLSILRPPLAPCGLSTFVIAYRGRPDGQLLQPSGQPFELLVCAEFLQAVNADLNRDKRGRPGIRQTRTPPERSDSSKSGVSGTLMRVTGERLLRVPLGKETHRRARGSSRSTRRKSRKAFAPGTVGSPPPRSRGSRSPTKSTHLALSETRSSSECSSRPCTRRFDSGQLLRA